MYCLCEDITSMKAAEYVAIKINRLPRGYVFTYADFDAEVSQKEAVIKALNRLVSAGKISKLSKGKYYKPKSTVFGDLKPEQAQVVKDLLEENGKITGYLTGFSMFNVLGLTTQFSFTIQIGKNEIRPSFKRDQYTIAFVKQKNTITKDNVPLLQILDAIRYIKKIPDTTIAASCQRFLAILETLNQEERTNLVRLPMKYSPATRALLGALLEQIDPQANLDALAKSLNPITNYKMPRAEQVLSTAAKWNIE